jgi:Fe-S-cluster containining protein
MQRASPPRNGWQCVRFCTMPEELEESGSGFVLADGRRHDLTLAQQHEDAGACIWLMHVDEDVKRCGIYSSRPQVCAVYPFVISQWTIDIRPDARCKPGDWHLSSLDLRERRCGFSRYAAESHLYATMVRVWNDAAVVDRSEDAYERFIIAAAEAFLAGAGPHETLSARWTEVLLPAPLLAEKQRLLQLATAVAREALPG